MQPRTIIFIGPQGSGKGTQIEKLVSALRALDPARSVVDIQTGRRFRALAAKGEGYTEKKVSVTLDSGVLQPLFLSVSLWADAMREHLDDSSHLLIDGFPRVVDEAKVLESAWPFYKRSNLEVINLETPESVVRARMQDRARADDTEASIEARLDWYREEVVPVLQYYRERPNTTVYDVDGTAAIDAVAAEIHQALFSHGQDQ